MLKARVLTAIVLLLVLYAATALLSTFAFGLALALALLPALLEWTSLMGLSSWKEKLVYLTLFYMTLLALALVAGFSLEAKFLHSMVITSMMLMGIAFWLLVFYLILAFPAAQQLWNSRLRIGIMGGVCMLPTWFALVQLKYLFPSGYLVLALIALVSIIDIGAFFAGRAWGQRKLAPAVSPQKSWAGFWGGMVSCLLLSAGLLLILHQFVLNLEPGIFILLLLITVLIVVLSVIGDLFESMLKRHQGLKDSGNSLPGHGGILDRIDSLMAAAPVFMLTMSVLFTGSLSP
ncbi:MAG: phosphatidate cytidylyltransferase [Pseudomonadales bacterium]|nr:phosphatidate cytidylyltransferase [Pseudomonadales bacterium]